jgi:hypothetical protein
MSETTLERTYVNSLISNELRIILAFPKHLYTDRLVLRPTSPSFASINESVSHSTTSCPLFASSFPPSVSCTRLYSGLHRTHRYSQSTPTRIPPCTLASLSYRVLGQPFSCDSNRNPLPLHLHVSHSSRIDPFKLCIRLNDKQALCARNEERQSKPS